MTTWPIGDPLPDTKDLIVPGAKLRRHFMDGSSELWHVYEIIEDDWIVFKKYNPKRGWEYFITDLLACKMGLSNGGLTLR